MTNVALTPTLYNAALAGFFAAAGAGANPTTGAVPTAASAELVTSALLVAVAVDAAIGADTKCEAGGATLIATAAEWDANISRSSLVRKLTYAAFEYQNSDEPVPAGTLTTIAANIALQYNAVAGAGAVGLLYNDGASTPATVQNPTIYNGCIAGILAAAFAGQNPGGSGTAVTTVNADVAAEAVVLATAIDTAFGANATITTNSGASPVVIFTAIGVDWNLALNGAACDLCYAAFHGQGSITALPAAAKTAIVAGIAAQLLSIYSGPLYTDANAAPPTVNNPSNYNSALCVIGPAGVEGANIQSNAQATAAEANWLVQSLVVAEALDAAIVRDATISSGVNGSTLVASAAEANAVISKAGALRELTYAAFAAQHSPVALPAGAQTGIVAGVKAQYTAVTTAPFSLL